MCNLPKVAEKQGRLLFSKERSYEGEVDESLVWFGRQSTHGRTEDAAQLLEHFSSMQEVQAPALHRHGHGDSSL